MNKIKGSQWRKWDLHFHTPSSYDYINKATTNQQIIDGLKQNEVSVVAITDHHLIDIDRIKELQELGKIQGVTVLPGIEFLAEARGSEPLHYIAIFPDTANLSYIWKQIESKTDIKKIEGENKNANEVYCDLLDTAILVRELGGIISIHAGTKTNSIENITNSLPHTIAQKTDIAKAIDIFEMGKESDCFGYNQHVIPFLKLNIDKHIPLIICSDNHNINEYGVKQNLWIKADSTFEGLKQIIFEPDYRVKIQKEKPDFKEDRLIIDEVRYISSNEKFTTNTIYLNDNLNVIIGGKSSGKSILLFHIAKTLLADKEFLKRENLEDKYDFKSEDSNFDFEIKTKGGFKQLMFRSDSENSIIPEIKYIPQNYLIKLAEPERTKTGNVLNKIIRDLINEDRESMTFYEDFISTVKANDRKRDNLIDSYFEIKDKINQLESQLKLKTNKEILEGNINSNVLKVDQLNKSIGMTPEQISKYNTLQNQLEENTQKRTQAHSDYKKINDFNSEALSNIISLKGKMELLSNSLENQQLKEFFNTHYTLLGSLIKDTEDFISNFDRSKDEGGSTFKVEGPVSTIFKKLNETNESITKELEPFLNNEEIKRQIEKINKSISEDKIALQSINQLNKEIANNNGVLEDRKQELFKLYEDNHEVYIKVIDALKVRTIDLEKDGLKIEGIPAFNFPKFRKSVNGFSDGRRASYNNYAICDVKRDSLFKYELSNLLTELKAIFTSIVEADSYALSSKTDKKMAIKVLLEDYFFDYWQVEFKNDKLGKMSTGKASFVILMLIVGLSKSKAPILIDQPEDNLDNRSITSDLVEYLKSKKLERQIILVTHNANVVVNADAENIIVAHQKGQGDINTSSNFQFDYINGSLENTFSIIEGENDILKSMGIREHIADIVEGGKMAFQKREVKYGFKSFK